MSYVIKDENNQTMRIVGRQEEAMAVCAFRPGWTFKRVVQKIIKRDGYSESLVVGGGIILSARDGGKGSDRRPLVVPEKQFEDNWNKIFKKPNPLADKLVKQVEESIKANKND